LASASTFRPPGRPPAPRRRDWGLPSTSRLDGYTHAAARVCKPGGPGWGTNGADSRPWQCRSSTGGRRQLSGAALLPWRRGGWTVAPPRRLDGKGDCQQGSWGFVS
jgi:hypothetical protein